MTGWWRIGYGNPNGWPNTGTGWFTGDLSQVTVLPFALTAAQIQTLYMYHNGPGCYNPTLTASPPAAVSPGTTVTLSASSLCSPGETPEYAFYATPQGGTQTTLQAMSSSSTYNWNTSGIAAGTSYTISVQSQSSNSGTPQGSTSIPYAFTTSAAATYAQDVAIAGASAYWPLWETSGTTAQDLIGGNNGTLTSGVTPNATTAPDGSPAMNFNGTGGYISTSFAQPSATGYSIAAWFNSTSATTMQVIASARDGNNFNDSFAISLGGTYNAQTPGSLAFYLDGTSFVDGIQSTATSYDNGQWYFVVGTWSAASGTSFNPSQMTLYVDGAAVATTNLGGGGEFTSPVPGGGAMDLGSNGANWNYYNGDLAQVAIFPTALTAQKVSALYYDLQSQTITFTSSPPSNATVGGATYTPTAAASSGLAVTLSINPSSSSVCSISGGQVSFLAQGACAIDANQSGNTSYSAAPQVQQVVLVGANTFDHQLVALGPFAFWPLSDTGTTTALDFSGNANTGTLGTGVTEGVTPGIGSSPTTPAMSFNGNGPITTSNSLPSGVSNLTYAAWVNTNTTTGGGIISLMSPATGTPTNWDWQIYMDNAGQIVFGSWNNGSFPYVVSPDSYNNGAWHFVVGTYSSSTGFALYVDGAEVARSGAVSSSVGPEAGYYFRIGDAQYAGWPTTVTSQIFNGEIADVAVFTSTLSPSQVSTLYSEGN